MTPRLLAAGRLVTSLALDVGYESVKAYITMFKCTLGVTPYCYFTSGSSVVWNPPPPQSC